MIVLADEVLETFFDHEFASTFKLTEKATEQQRSLGREIFDNLLATGTKLATSTGVVGRPQLLKEKSSEMSTTVSPTTTEASISTTELEATIDAIKEIKLEKKDLLPDSKEEKQDQVAAVAVEKKDAYVLGDESDNDDSDDDEEEDLSPDVLEEVDRLLKEYGDEED